MSGAALLAIAFSSTVIKSDKNESIVATSDGFKRMTREAKEAAQGQRRHQADQTVVI
jgi:hypothetical protein